MSAAFLAVYKFCGRFWARQEKPGVQDDARARAFQRLMVGIIVVTGLVALLVAAFAYARIDLHMYGYEGSGAEIASILACIGILGLVVLLIASRGEEGSDDRMGTQRTEAETSLRTRLRPI